MACAVHSTRQLGMDACLYKYTAQSRTYLLLQQWCHAFTALQALQKDLAQSSAGRLMLLHGQQPTTATIFESVNEQPMASASIAQVSPQVAFHISMQRLTQVSNMWVWLTMSHGCSGLGKMN